VKINHDGHGDRNENLLKMFSFFGMTEMGGRLLQNAPVTEITKRTEKNF
jgi:hypothetical protein